MTIGWGVIPLPRRSLGERLSPAPRHGRPRFASHRWIPAAAQVKFSDAGVTDKASLPVTVMLMEIETAGAPGTPDWTMRFVE